jgi:hypothetical protein
MTNVEIGERFVEALATKDTATLTGLFSPYVMFRGLTPGRFWEAGSPEQVVDDVLNQWFEPTDQVVEIEHVQLGRVIDRHRLHYRLLVRNQDGLNLVEQHGYFDLDDDGRISRMHLMSAGSRPIAPVG